MMCQIMQFVEERCASALLKNSIYDQMGKNRCRFRVTCSILKEGLSHI